MPYRFPRSSVKFQGHTVQNITDFDPNWAFPDYGPVAAFKSLRFALFGFWTLTLLWLWISTSNVSGTILMYVGSSLLIFSNIIFKMAAILDFSVSGLCRWQGFRDVSQVCFGISISNFICMLMVVIGKSLLIFSEVTFKMAAWWPYWFFWFPDSIFSLALNINSKLKWHNTYVYV